MGRSVVPLSQLSAADLPRAGAKAANRRPGRHGAGLRLGLQISVRPVS